MPPFDRPFSAGQAIAFAIAISFAANFLVRLLLTAALALQPALAGNLLFAAGLESLLYLGVAWFLGQAPGPDWRSPGMGFESAKQSTLLAAIALGVLLHGPADLLESVVELRFPMPPEQAAERLRELLPSGAWTRLGLLLAVAVLVPIAEEAFFRGPLFRWLSASLGAPGAIAISSLCFTLSHTETRTFPALAVIAVTLGWLRHRSASLWPCVLLHAAFNATTLLVLFAEPPPSAAAPEPSWLLAAIGSAGTLALVSLLTREFRRSALSQEASGA